MTVHVDDHHVHRNPPLAHFAAQVEHLLISVDPVTAPPIAQRVLGRQGDFPGHLHEIAQRGRIIVPIGEDVPVEPVALGTLGNPVLPIGIDFFEQVPLAFVHDGPAVARQDAVLELRLALGEFLKAQAAVQGARGALEVAAVGESRMPDNGLPVQFEADLQVARIEAAAFVGELNFVGLDDQGSARMRHRIAGHAEPAVNDGQRGTVFKTAVLGPFHPDQPVGQNGKTGVSLRHDGGGIGNRIEFPGAKSQGHQHEG